MRSIQKRSFLLFELLVSLALIVFCLLPLIKPHASMRKVDQERLAVMQMERIAQEAFCALKRELYENKRHTWEELKDVAEGELGPFKLTTGVESTKTIMCDYTITKFDLCNKKSQKKSGLVVDICLRFKSFDETREFQRTLYLEERESA
jgi:hypothetical protein